MAGRLHSIAMKRLVLLSALLSSSLPTAASAQIDVRINVGLPIAPPLVVVQPGIQVVQDYDQEVFFTRGWYWTRQGPRWYRARSPRASFVLVEPRRVPVALVRLPPGQYRHWRGHEAREMRHEEKAERRAWKEHGREERGHGNGHGRGH